MAVQLTRRGNGASAPQAGVPSLHAIPFRHHTGASIELLSFRHQKRLASLATMQQLPRRTIVYHAGDAADAVFIIGHGAVKSFRDLPSGRRRIAAFLFEHDLFGLAEAGHYVNSVQALTPLMVYRLDLSALAEAFQEDAELELRFLCKIVHELRESQHHGIVLARRHATGRLVMLLRMLEQSTAPADASQGVHMPMTRSDIADYLGLSLESVVRACRRLERQGIVAFPDRHHARVLDRRRFEALATPT